MQHFKAFRTISLIFGFALVIIGCATNKSSTATRINVNAKRSTEGIVLHFKNIPENTIHLNVSLRDITRNDYQGAFCDSAIVFEENNLVELKETKTLVCPFVKDGHKYEIVIHSWTENEEDSKPIFVNAVAGGGISPINDPSLSFNDGNNALLLSVKPAFIEGVTYTKEYSKESSFFFYQCMGIEDNGKKGNDRKFYGGFTVQTDELICDISNIYNIFNETQKEFGLNGNESFVITGIVGCNVNYGNMKWEVGITKTDEIIVSL